MVNCHRCQQEFPFQWRLDRHLARKNPCKERNAHLGTSDAHMRTCNYNCTYCNKDCKRSNNKSRHESSCALKDDYVRNMEIQLGIPLPEFSNTTCRFCKFEYKTKLGRHQLTCKAKQEYRAKLEKQLEEKHAQFSAQTINNTTNNNCTTNNVTVHMNAFGKENLEYVTRNVILKLCRKANLLNEIIPRLARQIHCNPEHPENHNIVVSNLRAPYARVYDGENYKVESIKDIIDKVMDNVTGLLTDQQCDDEDRKFLQYDRVITRIESEIGDVESKFKSEQRIKVKNSLYNNKNMLERSVQSVRPIKVA